MKIQLWSQDEYGTGAICGTFTEPGKAFKLASELVTQANLGNALSSSEQLKTLEAYFVEVQDAFAYSGNRPDGKHRVVKLGSNDVEVLDPKTYQVRVYIGSKFDKQPDGSRKETRLYMNDQKGKPVTSLTNEALRGKTVYFIKQIKD